MGTRNHKSGKMNNNIAKNDLTISDLSYLREFSQDNRLLGGDAYAQADTIALPRYGQADAVAVATGLTTLTDAQTSVKVELDIYSSDDFSYTTADARAKAHATTNRITERVEDNSYSMAFGSSSTSKIVI